MGKLSSSVSNFLYGFDRYAKPVSLYYKKKGSFETAIGGCCSIMTFTWLFYWVIVNSIDTFIPPGKYTTTNTISLVQNDEGTYP